MFTLHGTESLILRSRKRVWLPMISFMLLVCSTAESKIRYVNASGSATGQGSSWENAGNNLQAMIDASSETVVDTIFVAAGTYFPSELYAEIDAKARTFSIRKDVRILEGSRQRATPDGNCGTHRSIRLSYPELLVSRPILTPASMLYG